MSKRILVVEDQEDNRQILRDLLGSAGYEMTEAWDGEASVSAAKSSVLTSFSWISSYRIWTVTRQLVASRPIPN
jgi:CheY-like chemotaxis protein